MNLAGNKDEREQALTIVRNLLNNTVSADRINYGEIKSYLPIYLDGNSRKTICRIYFQANRYIGTISERRVETKKKLRDISDIERFSYQIQQIVRKYEND